MEIYIHRHVYTVHHYHINWPKIITIITNVSQKQLLVLIQRGENVNLAVKRTSIKLQKKRQGIGFCRLPHQKTPRNRKLQSEAPRPN